MSTVPSLISAIRDVLPTVDGVKRAYYPAPGQLQDSDLPAVVLYWGAPDGDTLITHESLNDQMWVPVIRGDLMVAQLGETAKEFAQVDALLTPIVDAFAMDGEGISITDRDPAFGARIYQCQIERLRPTQQILYAGHSYYGAQIFWSCRLDRVTGSP